MTSDPEFDLVPIEELHSHEEIDEENVVELIAEITRAGVFADPIWASRGSLVILNGHHRVEALRRIGAHRVPTWLFEYETDVVSLEPWRPGLPITKAEVVRRGLGGHLFPAKTTRHKIRVELPPRPTPLAELIPAPRRAPDHRGTAERSPASRADASESG